nr:TetR/AcrR family transcriptional regulator [uncultured Agrococcus sp.]
MSALAGRRASAREQLLEAASKLFYSNGMTATGIDAITGEAGVAKKSLYNNFASKHELMLAYIVRRHDEWKRLYEARATAANSSQDRVVAVFDAYIDHAELADANGFRGCGLLNAAAELPVGSEGRSLVRQQKEEVEAILTQHISDFTGDARVGELAQHFSLLLEGGMERAGLEGNTAWLYRSRNIALSMLRALGD